MNSISILPMALRNSSKFSWLTMWYFPTTLLGSIFWLEIGNWQWLWRLLRVDCAPIRSNNCLLYASFFLDSRRDPSSSAVWIAAARSRTNQLINQMQQINSRTRWTGGVEPEPSLSRRPHSHLQPTTARWTWNWNWQQQKQMIIMADIFIHFSIQLKE